MFIELGKSKFAFCYSLGMSKNNKDIQLNALHLHGVLGMTTKDIIDYFDQYDPKFLEWVSNSECQSNFVKCACHICSYLTFLFDVHR